MTKTYSLCPPPHLFSASTPFLNKNVWPTLCSQLLTFAGMASHKIALCQTGKGRRRTSGDYRDTPHFNLSTSSLAPRSAQPPAILYTYSLRSIR